jgi:hypothetical protein
VIDLTGPNAGDYLVQVHFFGGGGDAYLNAGWNKLGLCDGSFPRDKFRGCVFESSGGQYFDENRFAGYIESSHPITLNDSALGKTDHFSVTYR